MKHLIFLAFTLTSILSFGQSINVIDSLEMQSLDPDNFEYVNISVENELVIESASSILVDMSLL